MHDHAPRAAASIPPAYVERADVAVALAAARLYFGNTARTPWEDHEMAEEVRRALTGMAQVMARVRRSKTMGPHDAWLPPAADAGASPERLQAKYGRVRTGRWSAHPDPGRRAEWERRKDRMFDGMQAYARALDAVKANHDPADRCPDFRLASEPYRAAVRDCTCRFFPVAPPGPARVGPTPQEEDRRSDANIARRKRTAVDYGDEEVFAAMRGGPFRIALKLPDGAVADPIEGAATRIGMSWMVLSHPRENQAYRAEMVRARDEAYVALGLCRALVTYPPGLPRAAAGEPDPPPPRHPGLADLDARLAAEVDEKFRARTYDVSLTRNPAFRERFGRFVDALAGVKRAHDPSDRLHDHELGDPAYRSAVVRVIAEFFPPRVTLPGLRRDVQEHRTQVRLRLVGPAGGRTDDADLRRLRDRASYFEFAAEEVGLQDLPPCPRAGSLDDLFAYFGALLRACEAADARPTTEPAPTDVPHVDVLGDGVGTVPHHTAGKVAGTPKHEVAAAMKRHLGLGKPFLSTAMFAKAIGCSKSTVHNAIRGDADLLLAFSEYETLRRAKRSSVGAGRLTELQAKDLRQSSDADPGEQVAADEFVQRLIQQVADPRRRAELNGLDPAGRVRLMRAAADPGSEA